ncbi:MAG TPA: hypothetical protein VN540_04985 [Clostridia bacterium]|nr:hypothetical protein [Clostridia bacterium]
MKQKNCLPALIGLTALALAVLSSAIAVDWMNYAYHSGSVYSFWAKPTVTLLSFVLLLVMRKWSIRGWGMLVAAFACMFVTDILMSIVPLSAKETVGGTVFMVGGILSIAAHAILILRIRSDWHCVRKLTLRRSWLPLLTYGVAVVAIVILWKDIVRVGHAVLAPIYTFFFCTTMWFSWETVRSGLYPKPNAVMMGLAASGWFMTEIFGEIFNLDLGMISSVTFCLVWIFYGSNVMLWALSTVDWAKLRESICEKRHGA